LNYQICNRCVMDTSDPDIIFDKIGNCNHCNDFFNTLSKVAYQGEVSDRNLLRIVKKIKQDGRNNKYDCLIGVSGGTDSSYVAYIVKKLGLRPLAVHMDNGWDSEESIENIKNICSKLKIDYQSYVLNWKEFKDIQLSILKSSIPEVEIPTDVAIAAVLHRKASANNIRYIISGGNIATEGILPSSWFYNPKDSKLLRSIQKEFGTRKMKSFPDFDYKKEIYYKFVKGIKTVYILNYMNYSKESAINELKSNMDWRTYGGKHHESKYTSFVQSYIQPLKFNLDYRRATFSTQICSGQITRDRALEELKKKPYNEDKVAKDKEYICKKLEITLQEFENIMKLPLKTFRDYPNDQKKLDFIYDVYKRYFKKKDLTK
jgi:N-acetyl sugar amidotransferase